MMSGMLGPISSWMGIRRRVMRVHLGADVEAALDALIARVESAEVRLRSQG